MAKNQVTTVKDAVYKLQLCLLEGIQDEDKLFAAGSLMSQGDYQDVVTERSIVNLCGHPLCGNILPSERSRKGQYRISLKEHKVYDLHETYMYCSTRCVVNSRAFAASLQEERSSSLNPAKLNQILSLFEGLTLQDSKKDLEKYSNSGLSKLRIQEKTETRAGEVSLEDWIGPSNAIEGYVPQKDSSSNLQQPKNLGKGHKSKHSQIHQKNDNFFNEMDFTSTLIIEEEYSISKSPDPAKTVSGKKTEAQKGKMKRKDIKDKSTKSEGRVASVGHKVEKNCKKSDEAQRIDVVNEQLSDLSKDMNEKLIISSGPAQNDLNKNSNDAALEFQVETSSVSNTTVLKSSLKSSIAKIGTRSVTWADEKTDGNSSKSLCEFRELEDKKDTSSKPGRTEMEVVEDSYRFVSAEACARALSEAAEAVASRDSDISDAVSEAGIIILPPPCEVDDSEAEEKVDVLDSEPVPLKWPTKPGLPNGDVFDSNDSWYDSPPDGFSLILSPFATMFMALFAWTSSSSLAYIYGHDESSHEEYLCVNGREYPRKIISIDGRSLEIMQALAACLSRALPGLAADLRLPMPLSTLEKEMDRLLDTMSFIDPLPPFRMKQWQLLVLLFLDALSVCRIPALTPYMTGRRILFPKVLEGSQISAEEYEIMKDLIIPLGRVPQFAMQSGA